MYRNKSLKIKPPLPRKMFDKRNHPRQYFSQSPHRPLRKLRYLLRAKFVVKLAQSGINYVNYGIKFLISRVGDFDVSPDGLERLPDLDTQQKSNTSGVWLIKVFMGS